MTLVRFWQSLPTVPLLSSNPPVMQGVSKALYTLEINGAMVLLPGIYMISIALNTLNMIRKTQRPEDGAPFMLRTVVSILIWTNGGYPA